MFIVYGDRLNIATACDPEEVQACMEKVRKDHPGQKVEALTLDEWYDRLNNYYASLPLREVTREEFEEMLNVLPPIKHCQIAGVEMFAISEMDWVTWTAQYAHDKNTGKYWSKKVDITDQSTWIHNFL